MRLARGRRPQDVPTVTPPSVRRLLGRAGALDRPAAALAGAINAVYGPARALQGLFNGTWLGHPLHPLVTDVAIGAWTVTLILDLLGIAGVGGLSAAAAIALWLGVLAGLGSLLSGLTDWKDTFGLEQRVGFVHGIVMVVVTLLYVASGILRVTGPGGDPAARVIGIVGFLVLVAGGYLGGEMAFGFGSMVDHNAFRDEIPEFTGAGSLADLAEGLTRVDVAGQPVLLVREGEVVVALGDVCSHAGGPLHEGSLEQGVVTCPWHGSRFRVADGSIVRGPATFPQPAFEVQLTPEGRIAVRSRSS